MMASRVASTWSRHDRGRTWLMVATAWWLGLYALLFAWHGRFSLRAVSDACGAPAPDVRFAPSPVATHRFIADCGVPGLDAYRDLQLADLFYPASTALVLVLALRLLLSRTLPRLGPLALLPVLAAVGDYVENLGAWTLIAAVPAQPTWAAVVLQAGSTVKFVVSWAAWLLVIALSLSWMVRRPWTRWPAGRSGPSVERALGG